MSDVRKELLKQLEGVKEDAGKANAKALAMEKVVFLVLGLVSAILHTAMLNKHDKVWNTRLVLYWTTVSIKIIVLGAVLTQAFARKRLGAKTMLVFAILNVCAEGLGLINTVLALVKAIRKNAQPVKIRPYSFNFVMTGAALVSLCLAIYKALYPSSLSTFLNKKIKELKTDALADSPWNTTPARASEYYPFLGG